MKWNWKREILPLTVLASVGALSAYFYATLPEVIPSHFNIHDQPDRFAPKSQAILLGLGMIVLLYVLLTFIPFIDPFWKRIQKKYTLFLLFRDLALLFTGFLNVVVLLSARAGVFQRDLFGIGYGLLFILLGNYLPKLPRNFFFGIRSPWTLSSEVVWKKTHIVSGWLFVAVGVLIMILPFLGIHLGTVLLVTLLPVVLFSAFIYPFFLYKRLQREGSAHVPEL